MIVVDPRSKMNQFVMGILECSTTMFVSEMDIAHLITHAQ